MKLPWKSREQAEAAAEQLRVFAQPQRLVILSLLLSGERSVTEIADATDIGQPALSQQLAELRRTNMVGTRRQSKQVYYRLADEAVKLCVRNIVAAFVGEEGLPHDGATAKERPGSQGAAMFARIC